MYRQIVAKDRVYDFLAGLNRELDEVRGRTLGMKPLPPIDEVFVEVRCEENRRRVMLVDSPSLVTENSTLVARNSDSRTDSCSKKN